MSGNQELRSLKSALAARLGPGVEIHNLRVEGDRIVYTEVWKVEPMAYVRLVARNDMSRLMKSDWPVFEEVLNNWRKV